MNRSTIPYAELERQARLDLALRTLLDTTAPEEHVQSARRVLEGGSASLDDLQGLSPQFFFELWNLLEAERMRREGAAPSTDEPADEPADEPST